MNTKQLFWSALTTIWALLIFIFKWSTFTQLSLGEKALAVVSLGAAYYFCYLMSVFNAAGSKVRGSASKGNAYIWGWLGSIALFTFLALDIFSSAA